MYKQANSFEIHNSRISFTFHSSVLTAQAPGCILGWDKVNPLINYKSNPMLYQIVDAYSLRVRSGFVSLL